MVTSITEVQTDDEAREFIRAISRNGIEDEMEFLYFYETMRAKFAPNKGEYSPREVLEELVYCYGLDLV